MSLNIGINTYLIRILYMKLSLYLCIEFWFWISFQSIWLTGLECPLAQRSSARRLRRCAAIHTEMYVLRFVFWNEILRNVDKNVQEKREKTCCSFIRLSNFRESISKYHVLTKSRVIFWSSLRQNKIKCWAKNVLVSASAIFVFLRVACNSKLSRSGCHRTLDNR